MAGNVAEEDRWMRGVLEDIGEGRDCGRCRGPDDAGPSLGVKLRGQDAASPLLGKTREQRLVRDLAERLRRDASSPDDPYCSRLCRAPNNRCLHRDAAVAGGEIKPLRQNIFARGEDDLDAPSSVGGRKRPNAVAHVWQRRAGRHFDAKRRDDRKAECGMQNAECYW